MMDDKMSERMRKSKMMQEAAKEAVKRGDAGEATAAAKKAKGLREPKGGFAQMKNVRMAF